MARLFNGSSDYGRYGGAVVSGTPCTIACWAKRTIQESGSYTFVGVFNSASSGNLNFLQMDLVNSAASDPTLGARQGDGSGVVGGTVTVSNSTYPAGSWMHCAAVLASDSSRTAYIGGSAGTTNTTSRSALSGANRTSFGRRDNATGDRYLNGTLAEVGIWNVALSASDITILAAGVCPLLVRPDALVAYWPVWGAATTETELVAGAGMAITGTSEAAHPNTIRPSVRPQLIRSAATGNRRRRVIICGGA